MIADAGAGYIKQGCDRRQPQDFVRESVEQMKGSPETLSEPKTHRLAEVENVEKAQSYGGGISPVTGFGGCGTADLWQYRTASRFCLWHDHSDSVV